MEAVKAIAGTKLVDARAGRPEKAPGIRKAEVRAVTPDRNPYGASMANIRPKDVN
jgi:hypothetical protein